jgi:hypothetical protein
MALAIPANAATVKFYWTNPIYNADSSGTCNTDSTSPLTDLCKMELYGYRIPIGNTIPMGTITALNLAGRVDSVSLDIADSVHYAGFYMIAKDSYGHPSCMGNQYVMAIKARDYQPGLEATYYNNIDLTSQYQKRIDTALAFKWGLNAPISGMGVDTFSERWVGEIYFPAEGTWTLSAVVEDGWRAWIRGVQIVNDWAVQNVHETGGQFAITTPGWYPITIEAMHNNGNAEMTIYWTPPSPQIGGKAVVPASKWRH